MKLEFCNHCGNEFLIADYDLGDLREKILKYVMMHHPNPNQMITSFAKMGFRASDVKRISTLLWQEKKLHLMPGKSWVAKVIVT